MEPLGPSSKGCDKMGKTDRKWKNAQYTAHTPALSSVHLYPEKGEVLSPSLTLGLILNLTVLQMNKLLWTKLRPQP